MKTLQAISVSAFLSVLSAFAQTNFVYDQQSAVESASAEGGGLLPTDQPLGQSFTPAFSYVGFVRLWMADDISPGNGIGSTVVINLRTNSITGPILGSSDPSFMADGFNGFPNFVFSNPVAVKPGITYFLEAALQSGDGLSVYAGVNYLYPGGTAFISGSARPLADFWFREGVITVPEPSVVALGVVGVVGWVGWQMRRRVRAAHKA